MLVGGEALLGVPLGALADWGRQDDTAPFFVGGKLVTANGNCTLGPRLKKGQKRYFATAGHCFGYFDLQSADSGSGAAIGYSEYTNTLVNNNNYDASLVKTTNQTSSYVFTGGPNTSSAWPIVGDSNTAVGDTLCQSGQVSGTVCGLKVTVFGTVPSNGYNFKVIKTQKTDGGSAGAKGDSGGVVYSSIASGTQFMAHGAG